MKTDKQMIDELYNDVQKYDERKKKRSKIRVSVICAVIVMMAFAVSVNAEKIKHAILSPEWFEEYKEQVSNADGADQIEPFKEKIQASLEEDREQVSNADEADQIESFEEKVQASDDAFVKQALEEGCYILLNGEKETTIDQTVSNGGYNFHFQKIVSGEKLSNKCVSGNPITGTGKFKWVQEKAYFAIFEISRSDGKPMSETDYAYYPAWPMYARGYTPYYFIYTLLGSGYVFEVKDEYACRYAVEITDLAAFAGRELTIAAVNADIVSDFDSFALDIDGRLVIQNEACKFPYAIFNFTLDESFADEDFVKQFEAEDPNRILGK